MRISIRRVFAYRILSGGASFPRIAVAEQAQTVIGEVAMTSRETRRSDFGGRLFGDRIFGLSTLALTLVVLGLIIALAIVLIQASAPALHQFGLRFLVTTD